MDHKDAIELIEEVERCFDVNEVRFRGERVWPLIRKEIWVQLVFPSRKVATVPQKQKSRRLRPTNAIRRSARELAIGVKNFAAHRRQLKMLCTQGPIDSLFYSRASYHTDQFNGRYYDRQLDPLIELVRKQHRTLKLEFQSKESALRIPRFEPTYFVDPIPPLVCQRFGRNGVNRSCKGSIDGFESLRATIMGIHKKIHLDSQYFLDQINLLDNYGALFNEILARTQPKVVFLQCYHNLITMALLRSCRSSETISVDVQHGKQGKYHGFYTHWTKIPEEGYEFLPDYFWCWGEQTKRNIEIWQPAQCVQHRPIVGGNLWLSKWVEDNGFRLDEAEEEFLSSLKRVGKVVLVSVQYKFPLKDLFPAHLVKGMRKSPNEWLWLIRLHPMQRDLRGAICRLMKDYDIQNYEINYASSCALCPLLRRSHHHVTCWSSVCYEALSFAVSTTIIHPIGKRLYKDYIDRGIFGYADSSDAILTSIRRGSGTIELIEPTPYIETSRVRAEAALERILHSAEKR